MVVQEELLPIIAEDVGGQGEFPTLSVRGNASDGSVGGDPGQAGHRVLLLGEYKYTAWRKLFWGGGEDDEGGSKVRSEVDAGFAELVIPPVGVGGGGGGGGFARGEGAQHDGATEADAPNGEGGVALLHVGAPVAVAGAEEDVGFQKLGVAFEEGDGDAAGDGIGKASGSGGNGIDGDNSGGGVVAVTCDTAFPLASTVLGWSCCFAMLAMYRLLPSPAKGHSGGGGGGGGGGVRFVGDALDAA